MNKLTKMILFIVNFLITTIPAFAQVSEKTTEEPATSYFYMYIGIALAVVSLLLLWINKKKREGSQKSQNQTHEHKDPVNTIYDGPELQVSLIDQDQIKNIQPVIVSIPDGTNRLFGRNDDANVTGLNGEKDVSSIHFKLSNNHGALYINDMASANGVVMNSEKIQSRTKVNDGDIIQIGSLKYKVTLK